MPSTGQTSGCRVHSGPVALGQREGPVSWRVLQRSRGCTPALQNAHQLERDMPCLTLRMHPQLHGASGSSQGDLPAASTGSLASDKAPRENCLRHGRDIRPTTYLCTPALFWTSRSYCPVLGRQQPQDRPTVHLSGKALRDWDGHCSAVATHCCPSLVEVTAQVDARLGDMLPREHFNSHWLSCAPEPALLP